MMIDSHTAINNWGRAHLNLCKAQDWTTTHHHKRNIQALIRYRKANGTHKLK